MSYFCTQECYFQSFNTAHGRRIGFILSNIQLIMLFIQWYIRTIISI